MMHALAFRVMRLCRPDIPAEVLLNLGVSQDFLSDDVATDLTSDALVGKCIIADDL